MDYLKLLNENQLEAVTSNNQYLRIIAGAGSGKTRVLTYRISYLIGEENVFPSQILAITFTNKVAKEMKERTLNLLPFLSSNDVHIYTYHSFCANFLRRNINVLGYSRNFTILDEEDQLKLLKNVATKFGYKKGDPIVKETLSCIDKAKRNGEKLDKSSLPLKMNGEDIFKIYEEYEKEKEENSSLDFDDLLIKTYEILNNYPEVLKKVQNKFKYVLIDEFQDTNDLQFNIIKLVVGKYNSLYVVGDPDQTIYSWRGANQNIILDLDKYFSPIKTIILNKNYRSTSNILDCANLLIDNNKDRIKKDLVSVSGKGNFVDYKVFYSDKDEAFYIGSKIFNILNIDKDSTYKDIAVLYRSNYLSLPIEQELTKRGIPYKIYGSTKFFQRKEVKDAIAYLKLASNFKDNLSFDRIINVPSRKIGEKAKLNLYSEATKKSLSYFEYINVIDSKDSSLSSKLIDTLKNFYNVVLKYSEKLNEKSEAYGVVFKKFLNEINYLNYLKEIDKDEGSDRYENVSSLFDDAIRYEKENSDETYIDYLNNVSLQTSQDEIDNSDSVSLMTVHTAKGLEFNYIFIFEFSEEVFPNRRAIDDNGISGLEEERRLAYVAFTRAKKELTITSSSGFSYVKNTYLLPSRFIKEAGLSKKISEDMFNNYNSAYENINSSLKQNVFDTRVNNIVWQIGDIAIHEKFGEGKVIKIEGDVIEIDFEKEGKKCIIANHRMLSKKE